LFCSTDSIPRKKTPAGMDSEEKEVVYGAKERKDPHFASHKVVTTF
jgi:hypothetical protein